MMHSFTDKLIGRLGLLLIPCLSACVWRGVETDHYIGPVWFRYTTPVSSKAYVGQILRFGLWGEAGNSWGLALGVSERVAVEPIVSSVKKKITANRNRWLMPYSSSETPEAGEWTFSPFYLRVDCKPERFFISRSIKGAEIIVGHEDSAFTLGSAHKTLFTPPPDAISRLQYHSSRPLASEASVWLDITEPNDLPDHLIQEETP